MNHLFDIDCATRLFDKLRAHWRESADYRGMYRPGYSRQENEAIGFLLQEAQRLGLHNYADLAGNVYMVMPGSDVRRGAIVSGSHLDAVPLGGEYDGVAGVVGPMAVLSAFHQAGITPPQDIAVMVVRAEESPWFSQVSIGSKLAVAELPADRLAQLKHREDGRSLAEHMRESGAHPELLKGQVLFPVAQIAAFIELHIEQGPQLHASGIPVGVVTSIRGNMRLTRVAIHGESGHTGAVPMELRKDAVRAAARFVTSFEDYCEDLRRAGEDLVYTVPVATTGAHASPTTIPEECVLNVEARSASDAVLSKVYEAIEGIRKKIEAVYHVTIDMAKPVISKPAQMDKRIQAMIASAAQKLGLPFMHLPSGAGHDAAVFANAGTPCGMIFVRHDGKSHRCDEGMDMRDFAAGCELLAQTFLGGMDGQAKGGTFMEALQELGASRIDAR